MSDMPIDLDRLARMAGHREWKRIIKRYGHILGCKTTREAKLAVAKLLGDDEPNKYKEPEQKTQVEVESKEDGSVAITSKGAIRTLEQIVAAADIDLSEWSISRWKANVWQQAQKTADGDVRHVDLWQVKADMLPKPWSHLEPVPQYPPVKVVKRKSIEADQSCLFIPDAQIGYSWRGDYTYLDPFHDRRVMDCNWQVAEKMQPDIIILLGDMLDLAPWSSHPKKPEHVHTTQAALDEWGWWLLRLRARCPYAKIVYLWGNHEERLTRGREGGPIDQVGLRPALTSPDDPEALDLRRLLHLDRLGIEAIPLYGDSYWLWDRVNVNHGMMARGGGGKTVSAIVAKAEYSTVNGHTHKVDSASRILHGPHGHRIITAMSPGCMCRTDGMVPGGSGRVKQDYQPGVGYGYLVDDAEHLSVAHVVKGKTIFGQEVVEGRDLSEQIARDLGKPYYSADNRVSGTKYSLDKMFPR